MLSPTSVNLAARSLLDRQLPHDVAGILKRHGLPAACLAMYRSALPERRKAVAGMLLSLALTSFLTGVTEPLEFAFMFVAWPLYLMHALLTGTALALVNALGVKDGDVPALLALRDRCVAAGGPTGALLVVV